MITFKDVSISFGSDEYGLNDVSFSIDSGELVVITGPSGSGKTTIMRLLMREYDPTAGDITFDGSNIADISSGKLHQHRRNIGVVFQDYRLLPELNVWENIALPLSIVGKKQADIEERVTDLLTLIKLPQKAHLFPSQLSGGEAQRISIARALAMGPSVLFADEPTGNLDADTSREITELLKKIHSLGTTVLFATHDPVAIKVLSDAHTLELENGKLKKDSKPPKKTTNTDTKSDKKSEKKPAKTQKKQAATSVDKKKEDTTPAKKSSPEHEETKKKDTSEKPNKPGFLRKLFFSSKKDADTPSEDTASDRNTKITEKKSKTSSKQKKKSEKESVSVAVESLEE